MNFKALQLISLISYFFKKKRKRSNSESAKLHFYYPTEKYDDSIKRYFLKENSSKNQMLSLHNTWGIFRKFS